MNKKGLLSALAICDGTAMNRIFVHCIVPPLFTELVGICMLTITICAGAYLIVNRRHTSLCSHLQRTDVGFQSINFLRTVDRSSDPLRKLSGVFTSIYMGVDCGRLTYQILDAKPLIAEPANPVTIPTSPFAESIIKNLSFSYDVAHPILKDVNLEIPHGQTIANFGSNGSGKSTLIQLLGRYYDPNCGTNLHATEVDYRDLADFR